MLYALILWTGAASSNVLSSQVAAITPYQLVPYQKESALFTLLAGGIVVPVQRYHDYHYAHFAMALTTHRRLARRAASTTLLCVSTSLEGTRSQTT